MIKYKSISFVGDGCNIHFYNRTLDEALEKMNKGLKYALTENGCAWISIPSVNVIKNPKINIAVYPY